MNKTFISNLILVLGLNLTVKPIWIFGIDRLVQNQVGTEHFGTYYSLLNFAMVLNVILDFGITNFNNRNISQHTQLLTKHFSRVVVLKIALAIIYLAACCVIGLVIRYDFRLMKLLLLLCFMQFLVSFIFYLRSNVAGLHLFRTDSVLSATDRIIGIAVCAPFLWFHFIAYKVDIMDYVYAQIIAYSGAAAIALGIVLSKAGFPRFKWDGRFNMMILKKSFPFAVLAMLMAFYGRIDSVMLERLLKDSGRESGIYAQSFRMLDAASMIAFLFAGLLLPMFSRMLKHGESVEELVKTSFTLVMILALTTASTCFFFSEPIIRTLYKQDIVESTHVFDIVMCCFVGVSSQYIFGTLLTANGNLKQLNIIAGSGMLINILFNLVMIPWLYARGAAMVALTTQVFVASTQMIIVQRIFKFKMLPGLLVNLLVFAIGVALINYIFSRLHINWLLALMGAGTMCVFWALTIGLLRIKSILNIIKYRSN